MAIPLGYKEKLQNPEALREIDWLNTPDGQEPDLTAWPAGDLKLFESVICGLVTEHGQESLHRCTDVFDMRRQWLRFKANEFTKIIWYAGLDSHLLFSK